MYNWITLLYTWKLHNVILYSLIQVHDKLCPSIYKHLPITTLCVFSCSREQQTIRRVWTPGKQEGHIQMEGLPGGSFFSAAQGPCLHQETLKHSRQHNFGIQPIRIKVGPTH